MIEVAKALWLAGPQGREEFNRLFAAIARGMIVTQEPGMLQGPALLGGVYSTPMAMVRFFELVLLTGGSKPPPARSAGGISPARGASSSARSRRAAPARSRCRRARWCASTGPAASRSSRRGRPFARAEVAAEHRRGAGGGAHIQLDGGRDPLEYYALIAPCQTAVKQTEDILSDYKGQLIYGQQGTAGPRCSSWRCRSAARAPAPLLEGLCPGPPTASSPSAT